jgi:integrase
MATIKKRGNTWLLGWSDSQGRHRKSLGKISEALAKVMLKRKEYELEVGVGGSGHTVSIAFNKYSVDYLAWYENKYPSSYDTAERIVIKNLEPFFDNTLINKITRKEFELFTRQEQARVRPATVNRTLATLIALINKAGKDGYLIPDFKIEKVPDMESKPPKYYTKDELQAIYDNAPNHHHWWKLMVNTGMRLGELHQLKCEDIRADGIYITSSNDARTKSKKWRKIPIGKGTEKALQDFDLTQEYILPRFAKHSIKTAFKRACKRANIPHGKHGIHCLRHTFASYLVMDRVPLHTVQKLLGHAKITTTEQYAHLSPDYLQDSMQGVDF